MKTIIKLAILIYITMCMGCESNGNIPISNDIGPPAKTNYPNPRKIAIATLWGEYTGVSQKIERMFDMSSKEMRQQIVGRKIVIEVALERADEKIDDTRIYEFWMGHARRNIDDLAGWAGGWDSEDKRASLNSQ